jgi:hypothetical protein
MRPTKPLGPGRDASSRPRVLSLTDNQMDLKGGGRNIGHREAFDVFATLRRNPALRRAPARRLCRFRGRAHGAASVAAGRG